MNIKDRLFRTFYIFLGINVFIVVVIGSILLIDHFSLWTEFFIGFLFVLLILFSWLLAE